MNPRVGLKVPLGAKGLAAVEADEGPLPRMLPDVDP